MTGPGAPSYPRHVIGMGLRVIGAISALLLVAGPALAGDPNDADRARAAELVRSGAAAAKARRWDACITALEAALALDDTPTTAGHLGLCEEQASKLVGAYDHLRRALDAAPSPPNGEPWKSYQAAMARILERVAVVWITVFPRGAHVLLDGRPLGRADGRSFAVEPGKHTIAARLDGHDDAVRSLSVRGGDVPHIDLVMKPKPETTPAPTATTPPKAPLAGPPPSLLPATPSPVPAPLRWCLPAPTPRGVLAPLACAGLVTTLASGATAIALEVDRRSLRDKVSADTCRPTASPRPEVCDALAERVGQAQGALDVTIGAAITTGLLAGAASIAFGFERGATSPTVALTASSNGGGIVILGTW